MSTSRTILLHIGTCDQTRARVRTWLHTNVCVHAARLGHRQSDKFALSPNRPRTRYRSGNAFPDTGEIVLQIVEESALFSRGPAFLISPNDFVSTE